MTIKKERRKTERRAAPPMAQYCETICKPVDAKLDIIWDAVKTKTPNRVFWIIVSALAFLCVVIMGGMLWAFKGELGTLNTGISLTNASLITVNQSIAHNAESFRDLKQEVKENYRRFEGAIEKMDDRISNGGKRK